MRKLLVPLLVAFALAPAVRADDAGDAKATIEKAIAARGDKPGDKATGMTWKSKGTFTGSGFALEYTSDWAFQGPDKYRFVFVSEFGDAKITLTVVVNGEKAWGADGTRVEEFTGEKLEMVVNEAYQFRVTSLTPLVTEKGFALAPAKGKDVAGKATVGVTVTRDKRPAMTLYFDKQSGLLVKREVTVKDEFQKWKPVLDEAYFSDYKDVGGKQRFTTMKVVRDGKPVIAGTLSDAKDVEALDPKLFEKP